MLKHPRRLLLASLALLVLALGVGMAALLRDYTPVTRLPDGTTMKVRAVTFGREDVFVARPAWQNVLGPLLPASWRAARVDYSLRPTGPSALTFWIEHSGPGTGHPVFDRAVGVDASGKEYTATLPAMYSATGASGHIDLFTLMALPGSGDWVGLRLYDPRSNALLAEFKAPCPAHAPTRSWAGRPCPITRTSAGAEFTLERISNGVSIGARTFGPGGSLLREEARPARPGELVWTRSVFRVTRAGQPAPEWALTGLVVEDEAGQQVLAGGYRHGDEYWGEIPQGFADNRKVVRVTGLFCRRGPAGLGPKDVWTVRGVAVPKYGTMTKSRASAGRNGVWLELVGLAAAGTVSGSGLGGGLEKEPYVRLKVTGLRPPAQLALWGTDDRGRKFSGDYVISGNGRLYEYRLRLRLPKGARSVDLNFGVQTGITMRYLATPSPP